MFTHYEGNWHALFVVTGQEDHVKERLLHRLGSIGIKILVPKRKLRERKSGIWESRIRTLFPGYVLVNGHVGVDEYYSMKGVPGIIRVLKDKNEVLKIEDHEISVISYLTRNNEVIDTSNAFVIGERVVIIDGPLFGLEGLIESVDWRKGRARVRLNFIGESRMLDLSISMVRSA